jgi:hypothetical protein
MNRAAMGFGLSAGLIVLIVFVLLMGFVNKARADGSPKQLRELTAKETELLEKAIPAQAKAKPAKPRKILVFWLCNGYFHESIPVINKALELMGKKTGAFDVVTSDDMNMFSADKLAAFDAVLFNNTTKLEFNELGRRKALMDFVKEGKGIIGIHAATDNFYNWPEAAAMMGGTFAGHPWTSNGIWAIKNIDPNHPLNKSFKGEGFKLKEEIYRTKMMKLRENSHVLLALDMNDKATHDANGVKESDADMPVSWLKNYEQGRVFYCGLGHNNQVIFMQPVLEHYLAGIQFALGDLAVDATPNTKGEEMK